LVMHLSLTKERFGVGFSIYYGIYLLLWIVLANSLPKSVKPLFR
jgi:hypothetical protein